MPRHDYLLFRGAAHTLSLPFRQGKQKLDIAVRSRFRILWGRLADRYGRKLMLIRASLGMAVSMLLIGMASVPWQRVALRFFMGLAPGGLLPCIASLIRHHVASGHVGRALGWSTSAQYLGQVCGPLFGGFAGGWLGMRSIFLATCVIMAAGAFFNLYQLHRAGKGIKNPGQAGVVQLRGQLISDPAAPRQ